MRPTQIASSLFLLAVVLPAALHAERPTFRSTGGLPPYDASAPGAPVVTKENLLESERFWPYRVGLTGPWHPEGVPKQEGIRLLRPDDVGVLIRVEASGLPRIDFGHRGKYEVPIEKTDILERANRIRLGQAKKEAPNFIHAIRTRMFDSRTEPPAPMNVEDVSARKGFLCVYADPSAEGFEALVRSLAPIRERHGVMTIFFPLGKHEDEKVVEQLRSLDWKVPFLPDFLSEAYTRTLVYDVESWPLFVLQTSEGRVLREGRGPDDVPAVTAALDATFGRATAAAPQGDRP